MHIKKYYGDNINDILARIRSDLGEEAIIVSTRTNRNYQPIQGKKRSLLEVAAAAGKSSELQERARSMDTLQSDELCDVITPQQGGNGENMKSESNPMYQGNIPALLRPLKEEIASLKEEIRGLHNGSQDNDTHANRHSYGIEDVSSPPSTPDERFAATISTLLIDMYRKLKRAGLDDNILNTILTRVSQRIHTENSILGEDDVRDVFKSEITANFLKYDIKDNRTSTPRVIAMMGTTGVGKTTTLVKVAALWRKHTQPKTKGRNQNKVGIISLDTFRIAAAEQLKAYSRILRAPLRIASNLRELTAALKEFADRGLVLIDTPGFSPRDRTTAEEIASLFADLEIEKHLLVSATMSETDLFETFRRFIKMRIDALLFTKIDETSSHGALFDLQWYTKKPVSFLSTGQHVPHDLRQAEGEYFADLLLS